jgi:hypothetical protein
MERLYYALFHAEPLIERVRVLLDRGGWLPTQA